MDLEQLPHLKTFAKAAELCSFTAAGKQLDLTQAAVSQRIRSLEQVLGVSLFRREGGRVILTEAGRRLYPYTQRILALHQEARQELSGRKTPVSGELLLGASSIPGEHLLPPLLGRFHERYPRIQVRVHISDSMTVLHQIEHGEAHLGLVGRKTDNHHLEFHLFARDRMVLVVPPKHPWARRKRVTLKQVCGRPLILREAGSGSRHAFEQALERSGKSVRDVNVALELGSNEAIKEAVAQGVGLAVLSIHAVHKEIKTRQLFALEVTDLPFDREIYLVWDRRRVLPAPARVFRLFLETNPVETSP